MEIIGSGRRPVRKAEAEGERVAHADQFEWLARAGLVARGVVYGLVGILAVQLALGVGGKTTNQQGALKAIAQQPLGELLLLVLAVGLAGYALWRLLRAALGHGPEGSDDAMERVAGLVSGVAYGTLAVTAVEIVVGARPGGGASSHPDKSTGGVLGWPAGRVIVVVVGLIILGVAFEQAYKGLRRKFLEQSKTQEMGPRMRTAFTAIGVFGHLARFVVFALVGYFLVRAAIDYNPDEAVGLDGALTALSHNAYGPVLLGVVAAGLIGFGLYSVLDARYRKV
jgi:hypothetical protein